MKQPILLASKETQAQDLWFVNYGKIPKLRARPVLNRLEAVGKGFVATSFVVELLRRDESVTSSQSINNWKPPSGTTTTTITADYGEIPKLRVHPISNRLEAVGKGFCGCIVCC